MTYLWRQTAFVYNTNEAMPMLNFAIADAIVKFIFIVKFIWCRTDNFTVIFI